MRSTRAAAALARLNQRSVGRHYFMVINGNAEFVLRERIDGIDQTLSAALSLDDFVRFVDATGPQKAPRVTKNDAAFARQLIRKS